MYGSYSKPRGDIDRQPMASSSAEAAALEAGWLPKVDDSHE